jgi:hypothetical protein
MAVPVRVIEGGFPALKDHKYTKYNVTQIRKIDTPGFGRPASCGWRAPVDLSRGTTVDHPPPGVAVGCDACLVRPGPRAHLAGKLLN